MSATYRELTRRCQGGSPAGARFGIQLSIRSSYRVPLQIRAIPISKNGSCFVGALAKVQQQLPGRVRRPNIVIHQKEFVFLVAIKSLCGSHSTFLESRRLRSGIGVEGCILHNVAIAGPKSHANYLMGVGLFGNRVGARTLRRTPTGEARHRQIETAPKEMDRADLANESRAEFPENGAHAD